MRRFATADGGERPGWAERLAAAARRRPRRALVLVGVALLLAAPGLTRLELRTDGHALVPPDDPVVAFDRQVRESFGLRDPVVVLLETSHPDGIFNRPTLEAVVRLSEELAALPAIGPEHVTSLATERRDRVYPGTLEFRPFLDPMPATPDEMGTLAADLDAVGLVTGTLVSADRTATAILVGVPPTDEVDGLGGALPDRAYLVREIERLAAAATPPDDRALVVGAPAAESLLGLYLLQDLALLVPLALAVIALVLWLGCRRLWGVALGLGEVGACLVFTFGVMGWAGSPIYLTTAVLPVILTSIGLADEIHLFWHLQRRLGALGRDRAVAETFAELARPVAVTSLTTTVGFLSFLASPIPPVWAFGLYAAVGVGFCLFFSLVAVPAALVLLPEDALVHPRARGGAGTGWPPGERLLALFGPLVARRRLCLAAVVLVTLAVGAGASRLVVQDSWVDGFAPESPFRQATERVDTLLHGTHTLRVHLTFDPPPEKIPETPGARGPLLAKEALDAVGELEAFLAARPEVGGVVGPHAELTTTGYLLGARNEARRAIPERPQWVHLLVLRLEDARGEATRRRFLADDLAHAVVSVFLKEANYRDTARLLAAVRTFEAERLASLGARVDFAGDVAVSQAMIPAIVETQVVSLLLALLGAALTVGLFTRSATFALGAVAPAAVAVVWTFGLMGWAGVPLGVATSTFCAVTLGIGVDYGVHFLERFRRARAEAVDRARAARQAIAEAGPAIVADTLAIAAGFGLLAVSQVPATRRLGVLVAVALGAACLLTLVGLAAALGLPERRSSVAPTAGRPERPQVG